MSTVTSPRPGATPGTPAGRPARAGSERPWLVVAQREIWAKIGDKAFVISTLVSLGLMIGVMLLNVVLNAPHEKKVAVTSDAGTGVVTAVADDAKTAKGSQIRVTAVRVADHAAGLDALAHDKADALLEPDGDGWKLTFQKDQSEELTQRTLNAARMIAVRQNAARAGVDTAALNRGGHVSTALVEGDAQRAGVALVLAMGFAVMFLMSALGYGMQIASSVVEEKQSRIVEILVSAIPVRQLLAGKILGNTVLAMGQMTLMGALGVIGFSFSSFKALIPAVSAAIGWYIVFFFAGFLALAAAWAAAGALASRNEDLQQTTMPLTMLLMVAYFGAFLSQGVARVILSYVPIVSAILMPVRLFQGTAAWWEGLIALALTFAFAALVVRFGARLYRGSLLQTHGRVSYRDALAAAR